MKSLCVLSRLQGAAKTFEVGKSLPALQLAVLKQQAVTVTPAIAWRGDFIQAVGSVDKHFSTALKSTLSTHKFYYLLGKEFLKYYKLTGDTIHAWDFAKKRKFIF